MQHGDALGKAEWETPEWDGQADKSCKPRESATSESNPRISKCISIPLR